MNLTQQTNHNDAQQSIFVQDWGNVKVFPLYALAFTLFNERRTPWP
jgi:hypothetical protein